ncbi:extracellular solute-binding protein [Actinomyces ruminis]|uniref:extracellular solute-binding protein n=1 Tax=Actinomyces ruminis TaxID=1937003 RepID=UPI003B849D54
MLRQRVHQHCGWLLLRRRGNVTINSPEAIAGLQVLIDGFKDGYIPTEALEWKEEDGRNAFESGDLLFYRQWPYQYANNVAALGEEKFGVAALPTIDGKDFVPTLGGHNCGISAYSKNKATALKFVQWWTSQESEKYALETQTLAPILGSLYEDSEMLEQFPYLPRCASPSTPPRGGRRPFPMVT